MKIVRGSLIYIEMFEYKFLLDNLHNLSDEIKEEIFCNGDTVVIDKILDNREFVCIKGENLIKFLNDLDYIIDYDKIKRLDAESLCDLYNSLYIELDEIRENINNGPKNKSINELDKYLNKLDQLEFKRSSIMHYINFLGGDIQLNLPDGIDYPKEYCKVYFNFNKR